MIDTSIVGKVAVAQFQPKRVGALGDKFTRVQVGTFIGRATDILVRTLPDTSVVEGLKGDFELSRCNIETGEVEAVFRSGVAYLPPGVDEMIKGPVSERDANGKRVNESVAFAFNVFLMKAANPAGYSWEFVPVVQQVNDDPLAALRGQIAAKKEAAAAITDQSAAPAAKAKK